MFSKNLKYIFLASLLIAVIYPLANIFLVFPAFSKLSINNAEENAVQIGRFLAETIVADDKQKITNIDEIERAANTFNLYKIKLFSSSGVILYSTNPADISKQNTMPYFQEIVARGQIYTNFVSMDDTTAEGEKVAYDVVETYVPIMEGSTFLGAFEIYQDVTERNMALRQVASQSAMVSIVIMAIFLLIVVMMLFRIDRDLLITDRQLPLARLQSPFALLLFMAVSLFFAEALVMMLLSLWSIPSQIMEIVVDSFLLMILAAPLIYFFVTRPLLEHVAQSRKDQKLIAQHYQTEQIMRRISLLSITNLSLEGVLGEFIQLITSFPWLEVESRGAVFLVGEEPETLELMAHHGLSPALVQKCAQVPFGTCLCGKAAVTGKTVFKADLDEEHHISYEGIEPHGHYCVPFYSSTHELLGVFSLYTKVGVTQNLEAEETLTAASHLLAGVVERKKLEDKLHQISITDELTGILNRRGFMMAAARCLKVAGRNDNKSMLLFADMDNMKAINDDLGHQLGDEALKKTGDILKNTFRDTDIVGRIGGDEFAVLFTTNVVKQHYSTMVNRIEDRIAEWNQRQDRKFDLSLSIGLVEYNPENPRTLEEMLADADARMYEAKQQKGTDFKEYPRD